MSSLGYFPYHEPNLVQILILTSFFVFLQLARVICDHLANVGILGELFVGLVYGAPLANILLEDWEGTFTAVGYLGLIVLVLEGGMSTNLALAKRNLPLSSLVAVTGLLAPILLSLVLIHLVLDFTLVQAFTAGAAMSTTSLGTTFSVISQAGFGTTRLGAVLTSAAVADDVVGLVLLQVVISLGQVTASNAPGGSQTNQAGLIGWAVGRPMLASLAMLGVSYALLRWAVNPIYIWQSKKIVPRLSRESAHVYNIVVAVLVASAYIAVASVSGTSVLLGAFVAGLVLCSLGNSLRSLYPANPTFMETYEVYIHSVQSYILRPLFFASIGYAIPIRSLFGGKTVWQGVVYSLVCLVAKLVCGVFVLVDHVWKKWRTSKPRRTLPSIASTRVAPSVGASDRAAEADPPNGSEPTFPASVSIEKQRTPSLWPVTTLLGSAMVARGEISLLIANVARETSPELMPADLFYLVIWATLVCTILGPVAVGVIVKRMERQGSMLPVEWGPQAGPAAMPAAAAPQDVPAVSNATTAQQQQEEHGQESSGSAGRLTVQKLAAGLKKGTSVAAGADRRDSLHEPVRRV